MKKKYRIKFPFIIIIVIIAIFFVLTFTKRKVIKISNNIITIKDTYLYDKNNNKVGNVKKGVDFKINNNSKNYYNIKNSDYYLYYKDIKNSKEVKKNNNNHLIFNKSIKIKKNSNLYINDKKAFKINNPLDLVLEYQDDKYYYVSFLDRIVGVLKEEAEVYDNNNTNENECNHISVLYYLNEQDKNIKYLNDNGYYLITVKDLEDYIKGYKRFKDKAIVVTTESDLKNSSLTFISTNKGVTSDNNISSVNRYRIESSISDEILLKLAQGEELFFERTFDNQSVPVLNYHFFYDSSLKEVCNESICLDVKKFREHLDYLKNNNYKTLTMNEFTRWMYGDLEIPDKSVLITVDDGAMGTGKHNGNKLIPLLEEYQMNATLFLIAGWWDIMNYASPNLSIQSHTFDMHQYGPCKRGQINCASYEEAKADLKRSLEIIGNKDSFCFPFYYYSDTSLKAVKDVGFKLAFVGGNKKATRNSNKYLIPRYPILSNITMEEFKKIVN